MNERKRSPRITHLSWGRIEVEGRHHSFKDAKLFPGGAREWNWLETGTGHSPGIQPSDVAEILDHDVEVVVFGVGVYERLGVLPETLRLLADHRVDLHVLGTPRAVETYNELREDKRVGALIHTTC
jgi:hypothetical protein